MTFLFIDGTRQWLSISNLFLQTPWSVRMSVPGRRTLHKLWLELFTAKLFLNDISASSSIDLKNDIIRAVCNHLSRNRCKVQEI